MFFQFLLLSPIIISWTFNFMQFYPYQTQLSALKLSVFYKMVLNFLFVQLDPQFTIKLLLFNLAPDFIDFDP
jgi:hypothetical protein